MGRRAKGYNALYKASESKELPDVFSAMTMIASEEIARSDVVPAWFVGLVRHWVLYERARIEHGLTQEESRKKADIREIEDVLSMLECADPAI